ncbi:MAG: hypothetical protein ACD_58C00167G0013 [uncultured bacterium]|nr:MAG: hypothetical protein ACD_58C00167G0013 [uncultured bacterium]
MPSEAFLKLCEQRSQAIKDKLVFDDLSDDEIKVIEKLLEILTGFRSVSLNNLMKETKLSEEDVRSLLRKARLQCANDKLAEVFQVCTIRGKTGIYFSSECGKAISS